MGWKMSMIFANSEKELDLERLFTPMGIYQLEKVDSRSFDSVMNPEDDKIYIGKFNGNTIICLQNLPLESFDEDTSSAEFAMTEYFDHVDVVTLVLHSVVNLWGYSILRDEDKIRVRAGSSETGTIIEYGEPFPEEEALFAKSKIDSDGNRIYTYESMPDEEFTDDQVGEDFVFDISAKYFGKRIDACDELFETMFDGYTFSNTRPKRKVTPPPPITKKEEVKQPTYIENKKAETQKSPWWKFW